MGTHSSAYSYSEPHSYTYTNTHSITYSSAQSDSQASPHATSSPDASVDVVNSAPVAPIVGYFRALYPKKVAKISIKEA